MGEGVSQQNRQKRRGLHTYSPEWLRLRETVLQRDAYTCASCAGYGNHVDHINNNSHDNRECNLQTLCQRCHSAKTAAEQSGGVVRLRKAIKADGSPVGGW